MDKYIEENRGYITASKLKCFMNSPEDFFYKYILEKEPLIYKENWAFKMWTAIDDLISYWKEKFDQKYFCDPWLRIDEMKDKLSVLYDAEELKGLKKPELMEKLYWDISHKINITKADKEIIFWCVNELERQPLFDKDWWYETQKTFTATYGSLKLKWTLDRYKKGEIRDTKSTKSLKSFMWERKEKLWYDISMSFYWTLVCQSSIDARNLTEDENEKPPLETPKLIFDVVQKPFPFPSRIYEIPQQEVLSVVDNTIKPALDMLDKNMKEWEKTGDTAIWTDRKFDFYKLSNCDFYPIMESAIQEKIEILQ